MAISVSDSIPQGSMGLIQTVSVRLPVDLGKNYKQSISDAMDKVVEKALDEVVKAIQVRVHVNPETLEADVSAEVSVVCPHGVVLGGGE